MNIPLVQRRNTAIHRVSSAGASLLATTILLLSLAESSSAAAQSAPKVISVTPVDGAESVPTTSGLVFVFDQVMDITVPAVPSVAGGFIGNFEFQPATINLSVYGTWGADKKTLTLNPAIQFPLGAIQWKLNPPGSLFPLKSQGGVALATVSGGFTTGVGGTYPRLGSSTPPDGAIGVTIDTQIVFKFDQPMKKDAAIAGSPPTVPSAVAWTGTGVDAGKFTYTWSADGRSLICDYSGDFPKNTRIDWVLNPANAPVKLESQSGKILPPDTYAGHFTTGSAIPGCDPNSVPANWGTYSLYKAANLLQTSAADPGADTLLSPFIFAAYVSSPAIGTTVEAGSLTRPGNVQNALTGVTSGILQYYEMPSTEAAWDSSFPPGDYTLRFTQTGQSERVIHMTMPATAIPVPKIANYPAAQTINADADFALAWNAFTDAGLSDYLSLFIYDEGSHLVFQAPDPCVPRLLPATATSIVIPARTFQTNATYSATLSFGRLYYFSTNEVANMFGSGNTQRSTRFSLTTAPGGGSGTANPAVLAEFQILPNGNPKFSLTGTPGHTYSVHRTANLATSNWPEIGRVTMNASGQATFEDTQAGPTTTLYYHVVAE